MRSTGPLLTTASILLIAVAGLRHPASPNWASGLVGDTHNSVPPMSSDEPAQHVPLLAVEAPATANTAHPCADRRPCSGSTRQTIGPLDEGVSPGPRTATTSPQRESRPQQPADQDWLAARAEASLDLIPYRWHELGYTIDFQSERSGLRGVIHPHQRRITVFARQRDPVEQTAYDLAHELGHAVDFTYNDDERRRRWLELRDAHWTTPWFGCSGCRDYATGAGDFAEVFAFWQVGGVDFRSQVAPKPTPRQLEQLIPFFAASQPQQETDEPDEAEPDAQPEENDQDQEQDQQEEPEEDGDEPGLLDDALPLPKTASSSSSLHNEHG